MTNEQRNKIQREAFHAIAIFTDRITENQNKLMADPGYFQTYVVTSMNLQLELLKRFNTIYDNEPTRA